MARLSIILGLALFACSRSADRTVVIDGQTIGLKLYAQSEVEWTQSGTAHIGLPPFPKGVRYASTLAVKLEGRPSVALSYGGYDERPSEAELRDDLDGFEVALSPDKRHLSIGSGAHWLALHLLERGPPFYLTHGEHGMTWQSTASDLRTMRAPEELLRNAIQDPKSLYGIKQHSAWAVLEHQRPGSPFEAVVVDIWPAALGTRSLVQEWAARRPQHSSFLPMLRARVAAHLEEEKIDAKTVAQVVDASGDPALRGAYDRWLAADWPASHASIQLRLEQGMTEDVRGELLARVAASLKEEPADRSIREGAIELLMQYGDTTQKTAALDVLIAEAPLGLEDSHARLQRELPKLSVAQRTAVAQNSARFLAASKPLDHLGEERVLNAVDTLRDLNELKPAHFARLLELWPCRGGDRARRLLQRIADPGSPYHAAATERARSAFQILFDKSRPPIENDERLCAPHSTVNLSRNDVIETRVELEGDSAPCEALRAIAAECNKCALIPARCL